MDDEQARAARARERHQRMLIRKSSIHEQNEEQSDISEINGLAGILLATRLSRQAIIDRWARLAIDTSS